jgi:hypothetical protein
MKLISTRVPVHTERQRLWILENKDLIFKDKPLAIAAFCDVFNIKSIHNTRQLLDYYELVLSKSNDTPAIDYVPKEDEIIPVWNAPRLVKPCRPIQHIPGTTKVIVTYPSRV